ncbi:MAG TPA: hypothetical protein VIJ68_01860 [Candidatus Saccharimonadales bacterium]
MSESPLQQFEEKSVSADHELALHINEIFQELETTHGKKEALGLAFEQAEADFAENSGRLGVQQFGFTTANNAFNWWNYMNAYVRELELITPIDGPSSEQVAGYGEEKSHASANLADQSPVYFQAFDLMERERIQRSGRANYKKPPILNPFDRAPVNPFDLSREFAALVLANTIEGVLEQLYPPGSLYKPTGFSFHYGLTYFVEKPPRVAPCGPLYRITEYPNRSNTLEPSAVFEIEHFDAQQSLTVIAETQGEEPEVAAPISLDLAEAMAKRNPLIIDTAFSRTREALATRREAA